MLIDSTKNIKRTNKRQFQLIDRCPIIISFKTCKLLFIQPSSLYPVFDYNEVWILPSSMYMDLVNTNFGSHLSLYLGLVITNFGSWPTVILVPGFGQHEFWILPSSLYLGLVNTNFGSYHHSCTWVWSTQPLEPTVILVTGFGQYELWILPSFLYLGLLNTIFGSYRHPCTWVWSRRSLDPPGRPTSRERGSQCHARPQASLPGGTFRDPPPSCPFRLAHWAV